MSAEETMKLLMKGMKNDFTATFKKYRFALDQTVSCMLLTHDIGLIFSRVRILYATFRPNRS